MAAIINYSSILLNNKDIGLNSTTKVSFNSPYNKIIIHFTPITSLSLFLVRVTKEGDPYDVDTGTCPFYSTNLSGNTEHIATIPINSSYFTYGNVNYRISLYGCDAATGLWDITYMFMSVNKTNTSTYDTFIPKDSTGLEVQSSKTVNL